MKKITEESLRQYPGLYSFVMSKDPSKNNLSDADYKKKYALIVEDEKKSGYTLSLVEILSILGLKSHIIYLKEKIDLAQDLKKNSHSALTFLAENGAVEIIDYLTQLESGLLPKILKPFGYMAYRMAAAKGRLDVLTFFEKNVSQKILSEMLESGQYGAFSQAAASGHMNILEHFEQTFPDLFEKMALGYRSDAYREAARHGQVAVMLYLEKKLPKRVSLMLRTFDYQVIDSAAENGHQAVLKHLKEISPDIFLEKFKRGGSAGFCMAAKNGALPALSFLAQEAEKYFPSLLEANDYSAFYLALDNQQEAAINFLIEKVGEGLSDLIKARRYDAFYMMSKNGDLPRLKFFNKKLPHLLEEALRNDGGRAYITACQNGDMDIIRYFETRVPDNITQMIGSQEYAAFSAAALGGHLEVIQHLKDTVPSLLGEMVAADNFQSFYNAVKSNNQKVLDELLKIDVCFAFASSHYDEGTSGVIDGFLDRQLESLSASRISHHKLGLNSDFDVQKGDVQLYYYMIKHFIRKGAYPDVDRDLLDERMQTLLALPSVRNIAASRVNGGEENELLRFAMKVGNPRAVSRLMTIPSVVAVSDKNRDPLRKNHRFFNQHKGQFFDAKEPFFHDTVNNKVVHRN